MAFDLLADWRLTASAAGVLVGLIIFLGLLTQWSKTGSPPAPTVELTLPDSMGSATPSTGGGAFSPAVKPSSAAYVAPALPAEKTVVISPAASASVAPAVPGGATDTARPAVDLHMYETLVRRIGALEAELKRDPIFLDPLLKRVALMEKKWEGLAQHPVAPPAAPGAAPAGEFLEEFLALKEKVYGLQKILEHLAEGPVSGPPS